MFDILFPALSDKTATEILCHPTAILCITCCRLTEKKSVVDPPISFPTFVDGVLIVTPSTLKENKMEELL